MATHQQNPDKLFETPRLYVRLFKEEDLENLYILDSDPEGVRSYFPGGALSKPKIQEELNKNIQEWITSGFSDFAVIEKESDKFLGRAGFAWYGDDIELGYLFLKEYWGRGYATEVARGLLEWAKNNIKADRVIALAPENHLASQRVLEKIGMKYYKSDLYKDKHDPQCKNVICKFYEYYL